MNHDNGEINEPLHFGTTTHISLDELAKNTAGFTADQFIASLKATTTLTTIHVTAFTNAFSNASMHESNRRSIEPICHCIADLRRHNPNHPLRQLDIRYGDQIKPLLVAAKQFGIHQLNIVGIDLSIQSLVEFCRGNTHLKILKIMASTFSDEKTAISMPPQNGQQDSSGILVLDELTVANIDFEDSSVATSFSNFTTQLTYTALHIGGVRIRVNVANKKQEKIIVSKLIKPPVQQLTLQQGCPMKAMDAIEACTTVTQIRLDNTLMPRNFRPAAVREKLQNIATRNRELARFVANPRAYPVEELLVLLRQFDKSPTGRYMLARCFPGIPSFFNSKSAGSSTTGPKKRKRRS